MKDRFEELTIETAERENGQCIILSQSNGGHCETVAIHPMHLRYMAEKFGLIQTSDLQASKTIATLKRRLKALHERIEFMQSYLAHHSDHKHADLSYEMTYASATLDIADEFCADLEAQDEAGAIARAGQAMQQAALI